MVFSARNPVCTFLLARTRASAMALLVAALPCSRKRGIELAGSLPIMFNGVDFQRVHNAAEARRSSYPLFAS